MRHMTAHKIADQIGIYNGSVETMICDYFVLKNMSSR
jgi:hypothetical protein